MPSSAAITLVVLLVLAAGAVVAVTIASQRRRERAKSESFQQLAHELGLAYEPKAPRGFRDEWTVLPQIPKQGDVAHLMYGQISDVPVTFFRHRYVVSTGQATSVIVHWVFVTPAPNWPEVHLKRRSLLRTLLGGRSTITDDHRFNLEWVIKTPDPAFAKALLNARVRAFLEEPERADGKKVRETWHVVAGNLCCVTRTTATDALIRRQARRLLDMRALVSGERAPSGRATDQLIGSDA